MHLIPPAVQRIFQRSARRRRQTRRRRDPHDLRIEQLEDRRLLSKTVGLLIDRPASFDGYTLFAPSTTTKTYLVDDKGRQVHSWKSKYPPMSAYLQENGDLLRVARLPRKSMNAAGASGRIERFNWEGDLIWRYTLSNRKRQLHHDIEVMPNGNILMIAWERKTRAQAIAAGRAPAKLPMRQLWPDMVIEVQPTGSVGGKIVWEWHLWDHVVQNRYPNKRNYGSIRKNPQLVNLNFVPRGEGSGAWSADWTHFNAIDYNPTLDQIIVTPREFSEFWIIDHSTTTQEAAGHTGGNSGKGGDLLYRWGNPRTYGRGAIRHQKMIYPHDAQWIDEGLPGAGNILVFDNGWGPVRHYSAVWEVKPPVNAQGNYTLLAGRAFGPAKPVWKYAGSPRSTFFAPIISGAQRLPNGNTLIDEGTKGEIFEVTRKKHVVWRYVNPHIPGRTLRPRARIPVSSFGIPGVLKNMVFRAYRYAPDYPGLPDHWNSSSDEPGPGAAAANLVLAGVKSAAVFSVPRIDMDESGLAGSLTADQLAPIVTQATTRIAAWEGVQAESALSHVTFQITDLPGNQLGHFAGDSLIQVDVNAAGHGWFTDLTPGDDLEFLLPNGSRELTALFDGPASDRPDLLTVVMHELGHLLGYQHGDEGVMQDTLPLGTRRSWEEMTSTADILDSSQKDLKAVDAALAEILSN